MSGSAVATHDEALGRAEKIRRGLRSTLELQQDIADAYRLRDWVVLGYESWDAYVSGEFEGSIPRLDRDQRRELVVNLRAEGLSTRAIASATGSARNTVMDDLAQFEPPDSDGRKPEPEPVTGLDGKTYASKPSVTDLLSSDDLAELNASAKQADEEPPSKPSKPAPRPRTDVVATINRVMTRANDAADHANKITTEHLRNRQDEAATWSRNLAQHVQSLQRLLNLLEDTHARAEG